MDFKISCLLFMRNDENQLLLIKRKRAPNQGFWSPPGGKLQMDKGESPFECACREAKEETGVSLGEQDLHLFGYLSEKSYEGNGHWLMFLFDCRKTIQNLPPSFEEGFFAFYDRKDIDTLAIPPSDHEIVWPYYDKRDMGFWGIRAQWIGEDAKIKIEASPNKIDNGKLF